MKDGSIEGKLVQDKKISQEFLKQKSLFSGHLLPSEVISLSMYPSLKAMIYFLLNGGNDNFSLPGKRGYKTSLGK